MLNVYILHKTWKVMLSDVIHFYSFKCYWNRKKSQIELNFVLLKLIRLHLLRLLNRLMHLHTSSVVCVVMKYNTWNCQHLSRRILIAEEKRLSCHQFKYFSENSDLHLCQWCCLLLKHAENTMFGATCELIRRMFK